ncbi:MAG TPA: molybdopterin-dependent oxidoreductase [Actinomycetota bacterium]|nr:molybdopterin-dependent oxidoreductase [Actinomycetota bacterium]
MKREPRERGEGRAAGAAAVLGAGAALLATAAAHAAVPRVPFPPVAVAEAIVHATPGAVATFSIERLGHLAQPLLVLGTTAGFLVLSWGLGRPLPRLASRLGGRFAAAAVLGLPLALIAVASMEPGTATVGRGSYSLVMLGALGVGAATTTWRLRRREDPDVRSDSPADASRREILLGLVVGAAGLGVGWTGLGRALVGRSDPGGAPLPVHVSGPPIPTDAAFDAIPGLSPALTPTADFYVVDTALFDPLVDVDDWALTVGGLVERPFRIGYEELLDQPAVGFVSTLECISNEVGGGLISTARWTGVSLRTLLERAGVRDAAVEVVATSVDGYADSIPLDDAFRERTVVAIGMDGVSLPREHGFPARLLVPGRYGMKQPKWLASLELVDRPFEGYWERRGWSKAAFVKTMSRVDTVVPAGPRLIVAGVAFAGDRGISKVEVSTDGGSSWEAAALDAAISPLAWRRWRYDLEPASAIGRTVIVRGTDGEGRLQEQRVVPPHPDGASGYHAVELS